MIVLSSQIALSWLSTEFEKAILHPLHAVSTARPQGIHHSSRNNKFGITSPFAWFMVAGGLHSKCRTTSFGD